MRNMEGSACANSAPRAFDRPFSPVRSFRFAIGVDAVWQWGTRLGYTDSEARGED